MTSLLRLASFFITCFFNLFLVSLLLCIVTVTKSSISPLNDQRSFKDRKNSPIIAICWLLLTNVYDYQCLEFRANQIKRDTRVRALNFFMLLNNNFGAYGSKSYWLRTKLGINRHFSLKLILHFKCSIFKKIYFIKYKMSHRWQIRKVSRIIWMSLHCCES